MNRTKEKPLRFWGFQLSGLSAFNKKHKKKNSTMFWTVNDGKRRVHQVFFINVFAQHLFLCAGNRV